MGYERIVAVYDRPGKARDAARALEASGFPAGDVSVMYRDNVNMTKLREPKVWRELFGREINDPGSTVFTRAIEGGGGIVTLRAPDTEMSRAMKILDVHDSVDVHDQTELGDGGYGSDRADMRDRTEMASRLDAAEQTASSSLPLTKTPAVPSTGTTSAPLTTELAREEVLRLHEEQLDVGKRVIEIGKARVRRFVVEKPVEAQIKLHEEHATISRRPPADPASFKDDVDWSDKTFEITETAEQPVVTKKARVADEVVIRREGSDHVETVRDTVRRQDIELEGPGGDQDIRDRDLRDRDLKKAS